MTKREELFNWFVARNGTASHPKTAMVGKKWNLGTRYGQPKPKAAQPMSILYLSWIGFIHMYEVSRINFIQIIHNVSVFSVVPAKNFPS